MNLLTTVLNATPVIPTELEEGELEPGEVVRDTPQCVAFGLFMIWFSSITINLGPTFLSGALAANADLHIDEPSCPLVQVRPSQGAISILHPLLQGPYRHYILNVLWILINILCMLLIIKQLYRLHREFTDKEVKVSYQRKINTYTYIPYGQSSAKLPVIMSSCHRVIIPLISALLRTD